MCREPSMSRNCNLILFRETEMQFFNEEVISSALSYLANSVSIDMKMAKGVA